MTTAVMADTAAVAAATDVGIENIIANPYYHEGIVGVCFLICILL